MTMMMVCDCVEMQTMLSPVMMFGPTSVKLCKPVVLSFQHCASVRQGQWSLAVHSADASPFSELAHWKVSQPPLSALSSHACLVSIVMPSSHDNVGEDILFSISHCQSAASVRSFIRTDLVTFISHKRLELRGVMARSRHCGQR